MIDKLTEVKKEYVGKFFEHKKNGIFMDKYKQMR